MEPGSSQQQEAQSSPPLVIEMLAIAIEVISPAPNELPEASFIGNPQDYVPSNVSEDMLGRICLRHGIPQDDVLLPRSNDRLHSPPEGFIAFNRHSCTAGTLPPFN